VKHKPVISIIELHYHAEVLQVMLEVLDYELFDVQLFLNKDVANKIKAPKSTPIFIVHNDLSRFEHEISKSDVIFFNTMADHYRKLQPIIKANKTIVRIHNANTWFGNQKRATPKNSFEMWKYTSHYLRKELVGQLSKNRQNAIHEIDRFVFPAMFMKNHAIKSRSVLAPKFETKVIPLAYQREKKTKINDDLNIVIPGAIDPRKKDYALAYDVFQQLKNRRKIKLTLLGEPKGKYGSHIIKKFNELSGSNLSIKTYSSFVPMIEFDECLTNAHLLFLPIVEETSYTMYREYYGKTKISGAINDALKMSIPIVAPNFYPIENMNEDRVFRYNNPRDVLTYIEKFEHQSLGTSKSLINKEELRKRYTTLFTL